MTDPLPPRIGNVPREEWTDATREVFSYWGEPNSWEEGSRTNLVMTLANHPDLGMAFNHFGKHMMLGSALPPRPREIVILRVSWHLKAEYEWHYHVGFAAKEGMTLDQIAAIREGPASPVWDGLDEDRAVLQAVDELWETSRITDSTWAALTRHFDKRQVMDLIFSIGYYVMLSWAIEAFRMPLEQGVDQIGFDLKTRSGNPPIARGRPGEEEGWEAQYSELEANRGS